MKIICLGDITIDQYLKHGNYWGGCALNNAFHLSKIHPETYLISIINEEILNRFNEKFSFSNSLLRSKKDCPTQVIHLLADGDRELKEFSSGCLEGFFLSKEQLSLIQTQDMLLLSLYEQTIPLYEQLSSLGHDIYCDFQSAQDFKQDINEITPYLEKIKFASFGLSENLSMQEQKLKKGLIKRSSLHSIDIIITQGKNKIQFINKGKIQSEVLPPKLNKIVDTTGAGDCFFSHFIFYYYHQKISLTNAITHSILAAQKTIQNIGSTGISI